MWNIRGPGVSFRGVRLRAPGPASIRILMPSLEALRSAKQPWNLQGASVERAVVYRGPFLRSHVSLSTCRISWLELLEMTQFWDLRRPAKTAKPRRSYASEALSSPVVAEPCLFQRKAGPCGGAAGQMIPRASPILVAITLCLSPHISLFCPLSLSVSLALSLSLSLSLSLCLSLALHVYISTLGSFHIPACSTCVDHQDTRALEIL